VSNAAASRPAPLADLLAQAAIADQHGMSTPYFVQFMQRMVANMQGANRIIPCSASGTNIITLTPNDAAPLIDKYNNYDFFVFAAAANSTGAVTGTVVPKKGTLATVKFYISGGATQAGSDSLSADRLYIGIFADHLDGGAGGIVLK
jgi:hypothetical protein